MRNELMENLFMKFRKNSTELNFVQICVNFFPIRAKFRSFIYCPINFINEDIFLNITVLQKNRINIANN